MKKLFSVILILALFFSLVSCNDQGEKNEPVNSDTPVPSQSDISSDSFEELTIIDYRFYGKKDENLEWKEIWPSIIEERYGIKINVLTLGMDLYMDTLEQSVLSGDLSGIATILGGPFLDEWKNKELIYPLTDFLAENEVWNNIIPDEWKSAYTIDGELWAIPAGSDGNISWLTRMMRGDWLDHFGLTKPHTVHDFYEASFKFTYEDPDNNGINDTVGFTSVGFESLKDIFRSYDVGLSPSGRTSFAWNPNTNIWEDVMLKPEMAECLAFLNKCYSDNILDHESFDGTTQIELREKMISGLYGSTLNWDAWILSYESAIKENFPDAYMACVGGLAHKVEKNLNLYTSPPVGGPRVLLKTTTAPKETINWYVNTFLGDEWGFWSARIGPVGDYPGQENRACSIDDKKIIRNTYIDEAGTIKTYPGPGYIGGMPSRALYSEYEVEFYVPSPPKGYETWAEDLTSRATNNLARKKAMLDEYIENGMLVLIPDSLREPDSDLYIEIRDQINIEMDKAIKSAITGKLSVEDAIAQYREIALLLDANSVVALENEKIE